MSDHVIRFRWNWHLSGKVTPGWVDEQIIEDLVVNTFDLTQHSEASEAEVRELLQEDYPGYMVLREE